MRAILRLYLRRVGHLPAPTQVIVGMDRVLGLIEEIARQEGLVWQGARLVRPDEGGRP